MSNASVLIHFPARPDDRQVAAARDTLTALAGVARVEPGRKMRQLLLVDYDPRVVSAQAFLGAMRYHGLAARLVGM
jgi:hypothetical protein